MKDSSPYYTAARPRPGQTEIPVGTVHHCPGCRSDYICDLKHCRIERVTTGNPCCDSKAVPHSKDPRNIQCEECHQWGCTKKHKWCNDCGVDMCGKRHKVCPHCQGVDGQHIRCPTQPGYQFGIFTKKEK